MKLKTSCPKCDTSLSVNSDAVGKTARCPRCHTKFVIDDGVATRSRDGLVRLR